MANKKSTTTTKKATTKRTAEKQVVQNSDTSVVCPVCGAEFDILAQHEHEAQNVVVLGKDSGLGTIVLPVSKRAEALNKAGISTKKYFSMNAMDGSECLMTYDDSGRPVPVDESDPIIRQIIGGGTVPNRNLFRRWIMSQVFHWLSDKDQAGWLNRHGYIYTWEMLVEELRVQAKLVGRDRENFSARNRWFNKDLAIAMAEDYIKQMKKDAMIRPTHSCHGVPYIKFSRKDVFVSDIQKKIVWPIYQLLAEIRRANTSQQLYDAVATFKRAIYAGKEKYNQCAAWKDAYKGAGAYFTMQNLLRFHGCSFPKDNDFYHRNLTDLQMLDSAANTYANGEGWRLFGLMKQMIDNNDIDIKAKMKQWSAAKKARLAELRG